jgi:hypothetical protein
MARLGQCYVLKLRGGKWYVGYTVRGFKRIQEHLDAEGAKWTKKHPPVKPIPFRQTEPGKTKATPKNKPNSDEDKLTLSLMETHGIENVRGGSWTMARKMRKKTITEINGLIGKSKTKTPAKKKVAKKTAKGGKVNRCKGTKKNGNPCRQTVSKKGEYCQYHTDQRRGGKKVICAKCNRVGHESKECYAKTKFAGTGVLARLERKGLPKR